VRELVRDDALELRPVHRVEQPASDRDRGVLRIAACRERVRGGILDDVQLGCRDAESEGERLHDVTQDLLFPVGDLASATLRQDELVARVVGEERRAG
jgi:hypothetical protein